MNPKPRFSIRNPTLFVLLIALAVAAFFLHLPAMEPEDPTPFARGSFAVLADAEAALTRGDDATALADFRTGYNRAIHEGVPGLAERIRRRMGLAGRDRVQAGRPGGWPFLQAFALLGKQFTRDASAVEGWYLQRPDNTRVGFDYALTRPDGSTFWGREPDAEWTATWPFLRAWKRLTGKPFADGRYLEAKPDWPDARFCVTVPLDLQGNPMPMDATVSVMTPASLWVCWVREAGKYVPLSRDADGIWSAAGFCAPRRVLPDRIVAFTDAFPPRRGLAIILTREYKPL